MISVRGLTKQYGQVRAVDVGIAAALLGDPPVLLFDGSSSSAVVG